MDPVSNNAIVTGGAQGIGRGIAENLMAHNVSVAIVDINIEKAEKTCSQLAETYDATAIPIEADITDSSSVEGAIEMIAEKLGNVGILVNNAGGASGIDRTWEVSEEDWDGAVNLTLKGTFLCTRSVINHILNENLEAGAIINVSSLNYKCPTDGLAAYSAAKAGVSNFTKTVAGEAGQYGIRVNAVAPGSTRTPALEAIGLEGKFGKAFLDRTVLERRFGEPSDIAKVVTFLASDYAGWITGETICVDGGQHIRGLQSYWDALNEEGAFGN
jgi:3-oxoacyl-[acyl-carrier protein] reductase